MSGSAKKHLLVAFVTLVESTMKAAQVIFIVDVGTRKMSLSTVQCVSKHDDKFLSASHALRDLFDHWIPR